MSSTDFLKTLDANPTLVLNADFTPKSTTKLETWGWQETIKKVYENVVDVVAEYDDIYLRSPKMIIRLPSVVALKEFYSHKIKVPLSRWNVYLRDNWTCQYCNVKFPSNKLTFDHVHPRSRGGKDSWHNIITACGPCNFKKANRTCEEAKMWPLHEPYEPTIYELRAKGLKQPMAHHHHSWKDFIYWGTELEP